jgi:predicted ester cyclase
VDIERNKSTVRRYIEEVINENKVELIDEFFTPELAAHVKEFMSGQSAFPDGREEILALVGEGNIVMAHWLLRGTHQGEYFGLPATGRPIEIMGFSVYHFNEAGQIEDDAMALHHFDALHQIGATVHIEAS